MTMLNSNLHKEVLQENYGQNDKGQNLDLMNFTWIDPENNGRNQE
jgi:hypothetical protein